MITATTKRWIRQPGAWSDRVTVADDFDETPADVVAAFYGEVEPVWL